MKNRRISTLCAAVVVAFLSIYAATSNQFVTSNHASQPVIVTLNLLSGSHMDVNVAPGASIPTDIGGDQVLGLTINGQFIPSGIQSVVNLPVGGAVSVTWEISNGLLGGGAIDPIEAG